MGLGLLLGPLAYALMLRPEVVEVPGPCAEPVADASVEPPPPAAGLAMQAEPASAPAPEAEAEPAPAPAPEAEPALAPEPSDRVPFAFVNEAGLVLSTAANPAWGTGRLRAHDGPGQFRAAKRVDVARIPEALLAQRGRTFDLYGADGKVCTARLGELSVLAQHDGPSLYEVFHGSMDAAEWDEDEEDPIEAFERQTHAPREIRAKVWSSTTDGDDSVWLVAEIVGDAPCEGALWARDAELPPPAVLHRAREPLPILAERVAAHEASATLATAKVAYAQWLRDRPEDARPTTAWADIEREHPAAAKAWLDEAGVPRLTELDFGYVEDGCGDFPETSITSVDVVVDGRFEPTEHVIDPVAVFDADLDGRYELLYAERLASETEALAQAWSIVEEFYCPC